MWERSNRSVRGYIAFSGRVDVMLQLCGNPLIIDQITGSFGIKFEKISAKFFISCDKQIGICMPLISVGDFDTRLFFKIAIEAI